MEAITEPDSYVAMSSVMDKVGGRFNRISVCIFRALEIHKDNWSILFHSYSAFLALLSDLKHSQGVKLNTHDQADTSTTK